MKTAVAPRTKVNPVGRALLSEFAAVRRLHNEGRDEREIAGRLGISEYRAGLLVGVLAELTAAELVAVCAADLSLEDAGWLAYERSEASYRRHLSA